MIFKPVAHGPLRVWEYPREKERYTIGVDTATGVSTDWTVFSVVSNIIPFEQVAVWRAKLPIAQAATELVNLGTWYNKALLVIETNGPGAGMQDGVISTHGYGNCYQREDRMDEDPSISAKFGWSTTQTSKWLLIREMQEALRKDEVVINDPQTIDELCNYVYIEDKSKTGAAEGLNDDTVIALMLAFHGAKLNPQSIVTKQHKLQMANKQHNEMMDKFLKHIQSRGNGKLMPKIV